MLNLYNTLSYTVVGMYWGGHVLGWACSTKHVYTFVHMHGTPGVLLPRHSSLLQLETELAVHGVAALPLKEDFEEAGPVYGALCGLVTNAETAPKVANLMPQLVQVSLQRQDHVAADAPCCDILLNTQGWLWTCNERHICSVTAKASLPTGCTTCDPDCCHCCVAWTLVVGCTALQSCVFSPAL